MRNRLHSAWRAFADGATKCVRFLSSELGREELAIAVGLGLVAYGLWGAWRPGAFLVPGLVILWIALPSRPAFVERLAVPAARKPRKG